MNDALSLRSLRGAPPLRVLRDALGTLVLASALTACGGGGGDAGSGRRTEHQATASDVTTGDESANSGGHGEDPNASHDPEGADGVHDEAEDQPHPDEAAPESDDAAAGS